ncbi:type VII secretion protein EsxR [Nocardia sp. NPDC058480]|uniref:type VII secretion protein EsxR n=1 Tax=unclassified Nocardia TaxID=2637762 RepID=UPI003651334A
MTILYDPKAMNELFSDLQEFGGKMRGQISELETAATNFKAALQGENAHINFEKADGDLKAELGDTLERLDNLAAAVESALNRALEADGKVGDGFADF